jgi:hypothetical protein
MLNAIIKITLITTSFFFLSCIDPFKTQITVKLKANTSGWCFVLLEKDSAVNVADRKFVELDISNLAMIKVQEVKKLSFMILNYKDEDVTNKVQLSRFIKTRPSSEYLAFYIPTKQELDSIDFSDFKSKTVRYMKITAHQLIQNFERDSAFYKSAKK